MSSFFETIRRHVRGLQNHARELVGQVRGLDLHEPGEDRDQLMRETALAAIGAAERATQLATAQLELLEMYHRLVSEHLSLPTRLKKAKERLVREHQAEAMQRLNTTKAVTANEAANVRALDAELRSAVPIKTKRYAEIARQLNLTQGRARYIVEGQRRSTKK